MEFYESYYSPIAWQLDKWSFQENNRVKASRIKKVATMLETRYRNHNRIGKHEYPVPRWGLRKELNWDPVKFFSKNK